MTKSRITVGCFEEVSLPDLGLQSVIAKIDTGAFSGAIHCTDIHVERRGVLRKRFLKFTPAGKAKLATETDQFLKKHVRSATGHRVVRYLVKTTIVVQGKSYPIEIGLSDRSDMKYQVLVGRRFLREHNMLVDVTLNVAYDDEGDTPK
jgi:hypothetical protein